MKLSRLFVLSAFGLMSLGVSAADLIERTAPEEPEWTIDVASIDKTPCEFKVGEAYALYNVGSNLFYYRGNSWGTQATGSADNALAVRFVIPSGKSLNDKELYLRDFDDRDGQMKWRTAFITFDSKVTAVYGEGVPAMFIDNNDGGAALLWVESCGSLLYHLSIAETNTNAKPEGAFIGIDPYGPGVEGGESGTVIMPKITDGNLEWQFFALPEMTEYFQKLDVFDKSEELKSIIEKAEEAGADISAAEAVYNSETSTVEQMEAAIKALREAIAAMSDISGSADNPGDATALIENPDFGYKDASGWLGSSPGWGYPADTQGKAEVPEFYNATFDMYQDLVGMPKGVYGLSANTTFRGSWEEYQSGTEAPAKLYASVTEGEQANPFFYMWSARNTAQLAKSDTEWGAGAGEVSQTDGDVTYYIPNDPSCARIYFEKGYYRNAVAFAVNDGAARIGVKKGAKLSSSTDWDLFDTFRLTYYGDEGEASYTAWLKDNAKNLYATEALATGSFVEAYMAVVNGLTATDATSANAAFETAKKSEELDALKANQSLWGQWLVALQNAENYTTGDYGSLSTAAVLGEYISFDGEEQKSNPTWDNETIKAEIEHIAQMIADIIAEKMQNITVGEDVTETYIGLDDAEFANGKGGWTLEGNCNFGAGGAEAYNQKFDLYKQIESVNAAGVYELQLQGFFRLERDQTAYDMYGRGEQVKTKAWIYMNDVKSYVGCVFDEAVPSGVFENGDNATDGQYWVEGNTDNWYPNTMTSAVECFNHDMYKVKAYGLVASAGDALRIGIAGDMTGANWMMWDKFKLTYVGYDAATIRPILEEAIANMESLDEPMGKDIFAKATAAKTAAEAALNGSDGQAMFEALKNVWAVDAEIISSVALFKKLKNAIEGLEEMFNSATNEDAIGEASAFKEQLEADIADHKYNDADVPALLAQIKGFRYKMRMPAEITVGTDLTSVLESPEYSDDEGAATSEGWEGTTVGLSTEYMNAEIFNTAEFDHYQEIPGLPAGKYEVTVKAFYRAGTAVEDYAAYQEGKDSCDNVKLYANSDSVLIHRLAEYADGLHAGETDWVEVAEGAGSYVPNMMSTAATLFDEQDDALVNTITATVGTNGILRFGLVKKIGIANDWCLFDEWTLTYVGEGEVNPGIKGDVNGDGAVDVADISAVIGQMAGTANYGDAADVNGDGSVDVADISNIITIMADQARAAKAIEE